MARTYLDFNATSPLRPEAKAAMVAALDRAGNASSVHAEGRAARGIIEEAREAVARLCGADPAEVVFTSGATETNNWVISRGWDNILHADIEHDSVLEPIAAADARKIKLSVDEDGVADVGQLADHVLIGSAPIGRDLATLQFANSETGVLQDVAAVGAFCAAHGVASHCDSVQAPGRVAIDFRGLGLDLMSVSAHKMGGPQGIGALIIRDGFDMTAASHGGGQERRRRAGTENVAAIAGFGAAATAAKHDLMAAPKLAAMRDELEAAMLAAHPGAVAIGAKAARLPNTTCIAVPGTRADALVIKLDLKGFAVSAGSACSSGKIGASRALAAMGMPDALASAAIRVSLGWTTTQSSLEQFLTTWQAIVSQSETVATN
ncbi:MAG: cysteine desulfurase family protein [Pseudomonadota bacterium]